MAASDIADRTETVKLLRQHGIIPTHQRLVIAHALLSHRQHISAEQLLTHVNQTHAEVSKATIYNTLNLLVEKNMVREVIVDPERVFYCTNMEPHNHFFDVDTSALIDIDSKLMQVTEMPPLPPGMILEGTEIVVRIRRTSAGSTVQ
jgi:Fur family iron response transcriptional regulator